MFNKMSCSSPSFKANTTIKVSNNILSKEDTKILTKMGQKIGTNMDSINFSVRNYNNDLVGISHKSNFNINGEDLEVKSTKVLANFQSRVYKYIKNKLEDLQKLYSTNQI